MLSTTGQHLTSDESAMRMSCVMYTDFPQEESLLFPQRLLSIPQSQFILFYILNYQVSAGKVETRIEYNFKITKLITDKLEYLRLERQLK